MIALRGLLVAAPPIGRNGLVCSELTFTISPWHDAAAETAAAREAAGAAWAAVTGTLKAAPSTGVEINPLDFRPVQLLHGIRHDIGGH
ncbi:hypothetical protein [Streptomyces nigrescens]|uniref:hypothetical protein n=1 Tax=Streptomyces nigrescens TaxID=1920 RepID=UPI00349483F9